MIDCEEESQRPRTFRGEDPALTNEATGGPSADGWTCGDARQFRDGTEQSLDRTLSETFFPCSDPLSSIPNPAEHPS